MPLANEGTPEPVALNDGTATQFDRGYYQDPDQSEIILIVPDNVAPWQGLGQGARFFGRY